MELLTTIGAVFTAITSLFYALRQPVVRLNPPNFMTDLGSFYGYNGKLGDIRNKDVIHLNGSIYLDYTGSGLYRTSQLRSVFELDEKTLFANPHSLSPASTLTTDLVEEVEILFLNFLVELLTNSP
jgi:hypothetical protein